MSHLALHNFRSYTLVDVELAPGVTAFVGRNGQGKTNLVEAIDYLSRLSSHRVSSDAPLVRAGAPQAIVRAAVVKDGRTAVLEVELNPGKSNKGRINKSTLPRARDLIGLVRTVVFSPEDLTLVKGDPGDRRRFLDDLLVLRTPRLAGTLADHDRILKQRATLLKTAGQARRGSTNQDAALSTLDVWDAHLARVGSELLAERLALVERLRPYVGAAYATVARGATREDAGLDYKSSFELPPAAVADPAAPDRGELTEALLAELGRRRNDELDRGVCLVGPHRDDLVLSLGLTDDGTTGAGARLPVKGYASHGESWSFALALRLASYDLLRADGDDPILILDDVFAELDIERRAPAGRPRRRRRAGAGDGGGAGRRPGLAGRGPLHRGRRGGDP